MSKRARQYMGKVITIDGPAASGKTSVSRELARRLGWDWVSTGAFYRGLGYVADRLQYNLDDERALAELALSPKWHVAMNAESTRVFLGAEDVTDQIFQEHVGGIASKVSQLPKVREALLQPQRDCQNQTLGLIAEGRDCGTVVFPSADIKIYLTARQEDRALRRAKESGADAEEIQKAQVQRDQQDSTRKIAPLQVPENSFVVDTSTLNFQQVIDLVEKHVQERLKKA